MFGAFEKQLREQFEAVDKRITDNTKRIHALEVKNSKEDRGDFLPAGHNQADLNEMNRLKQKLKEATDENVNLSDELRHIQRRVFDYLDKGSNPSGSGEGI